MAAFGGLSPTGPLTFKSSRLEGSVPGFLPGAGGVCLGALGTGLVSTEFVPLLFLSPSGLKKKIRVYTQMTSVLMVLCSVFVWRTGRTPAVVCEIWD